ncbi:MAG TPA: DUF748 domain-containing protein [Pelomicrobium sp.]|nr:DUF748 domain-containing protein [Pelomicrobium sp.]
MPEPDTSKTPSAKQPWYLSGWLLGGVAALMVYTLVGFVVVPALVRHYVPKIAAEQFQRQATIGEVRFNPFLFRLEAKDFAFREADGAGIAGFQRLFVDFELASLFRWAWTFAEIRIEQPSVDLVVGEDNRLNLAKVLDALPPPDPNEPADEGPPPRLVIQNAAVAAGKVSFTDRSNPTHATAVVEPIDLELKNISTLPDRRGPYEVSAQLPGGGTVAWQGEVSLQPVASSGTLRIDGFKPATAWKFVQDRLRLAEPAGTVDVAVTYRFGYATGVTTLTADPIKVSVQALALTEEGGAAPIIELAAIEVPGARFDLAARELAVPELTIRDGRAAASVAADGTVNWATLVKATPAAAPAAAESAPEAASAPWKVRVESFKLDNVALDYRDASRAVPIRVTAGSSGVSLAATAETGGASPKVVVENLAANLGDIAWSEAESGASLMTIQSVAAEGGQLTLAEREARLARVAVTGGALELKRAADGSIRIVTVLGAGDRGKVRRELKEAGESAAAEGRPWRFALDELALSSFQVGLVDEGTEPPVRYDLQEVGVTVKDVVNDGKTPVKVDAKLQVKQGGSVSATATAALTGESADAQVKLARVTLAPLAPLVSRYTTLKLDSGDVSGTTKVTYRAGQSAPAIRATGAVAVGNLRLNEADTGERFLAWKALSANGIDFRLGPDRLAIEEVRLQEPGAKIVVFEDRSVNLGKVLKREDAAAAAETPARPAQEDKAAPFPIAVERVRVENATVDFSDLSLVLPFTTRVQEFKGAATGISSDPASRASLEFEGRVGEFGEAAVDGSLAPFAPKRFTDIGVVFRNVAMSPLSPYTATFAGRKIASGKLFLDLQYKIEDSRMLGENKVVLEEFTLGEKVESPDAASLPLDLAVALLTDSEGKIDIAVPVSGDIDNPEFSYGHVVWQAIVNVITKIVTAPFRALGAALGGDAENLGTILFQPGRAELSPPEREKLNKVADALAKRPQLKVVANGGVDPAVDGPAIKERNVRLALAQKLGVKLAPGEDPGPVAFDNAKTQRALEALLTERGGDKAMAEFQAAFEQKAGRKANRVNPALALIGQASEDREFYTALFAHLVETAPKPDAQLQALAESRQTALVEALTVKAGLDPKRVAAGKAETVEAKDKAVPSKLGLEPLAAGG